MMHFSSLLCMVFASFTTTLHLSLKLNSLVIPPGGGLQQLLLQEMHCAIGGHLGTRKTTHDLLLYVWWPGLSRDVSAFVRGCTFC